jgi:hypothetical protein
MPTTFKELAQTYASNPEFGAQAKQKYTELLERSAIDREFRNTLLTNPRAAVAEFGGRDISDVPASFNIAFIENKAGATIVLPPMISAEAELSEEELETVAGGTTPLCAAALASSWECAAGALALSAAVLHVINEATDTSCAT